MNRTTRLALHFVLNVFFAYFIVMVFAGPGVWSGPHAAPSDPEAARMVRQAQRGNVADVLATLETRPAWAELRDSQGRTLLHAFALASGHTPGSIEAVEPLLTMGIPVDARDPRGRTPLHAAAEFGGVEMVEALIAAGAEVNAPDHGGRSPLWLARHARQEEVEAVLRGHGGRVAQPRLVWLVTSWQFWAALIAGAVFAWRRAGRPEAAEGQAAGKTEA